MALSKDLIGVGVATEEAIRVGDTGPQYLTGLGGSAISIATQIGNPNGATILELNVTTNAVGSVVFVTTTELDRTYTIVNSSSNAGNVFPPTTTASFNGLSNGASFSLPHLLAKVSSLNAERPLRLGGTNWPSCPEAVLHDGHEDRRS